MKDLLKIQYNRFFFFFPRWYCLFQWPHPSVEIFNISLPSTISGTSTQDSELGNSMAEKSYCPNGGRKKKEDWHARFWQRVWFQKGKSSISVNTLTIHLTWTNEVFNVFFKIQMHICYVFQDAINGHMAQMNLTWQGSTLFGKTTDLHERTVNACKSGSFNRKKKLFFDCLPSITAIYPHGTLTECLLL